MAYAAGAARIRLAEERDNERVNDICKNIYAGQDYMAKKFLSLINSSRSIVIVLEEKREREKKNEDEESGNGECEGKKEGNQERVSEKEGEKEGVKREEEKEREKREVEGDWYVLGTAMLTLQNASDEEAENAQKVARSFGIYYCDREEEKEKKGGRREDTERNK